LRDVLYRAHTHVLPSLRPARGEGAQSDREVAGGRALAVGGRPARAGARQAPRAAPRLAEAEPRGGGGYPHRDTPAVRIGEPSARIRAAVAVALAVDWIGTAETRVTSYAVTGSPSGIVLNVRSGNVDVVGGGTSAVEVRRTEHLSYGHRAREKRSVSGGILRIDSSCPTVIVGTCSSDYRMTVPDNVPITVHTGDGTVHMAAFRG